MKLASTGVWWVLLSVAGGPVLAVEPPTTASAAARAGWQQLLGESSAPPEGVWPEGAPAPRVLTGLAPRRAEADAEAGAAADASARAFLERHRWLLGGLDPAVDLQPTRVGRLGDGHTVRFRQVYRGIAVDGRSVWVWLDVAGRVEAVRVTVAPRPRGEPTPALSEASALDLARRHLGSPAVYRAPTSRLVWWAEPRLDADTPPVLAWEIHPDSHPAFPADRYLIVSATTGEILADEDRLVHARANLFEQNPVVDAWEAAPGDLTAALDADAGALVSPVFEAIACLDLHQTIPVDSDYGEVQVHVCSIDALARPDSHGDFLYTPDYLNAADAFAEVQAFQHAHVGLSFFDALGASELSTLPLQVLVNFQSPDGNDVANMSDPYGTLVPVTNAYFTGGSVAGETGEHPGRLQFGQGADADVAYDGDVVFHELGHAVVSALDGPRRSSLDVHGINNEPSALNEGYADYFSSALTGDPVFAEYASYKPDKDPATLGWRHLDNTATCDANLSSEPHNDGTIWAGALWTIRSGLSTSEARRYDQAIIEALRGMGGYADFSVAATLTLGVVHGLLGAELGDALGREMQARQLFDCHRWRDVEEGPRSLGANGRGSLSLTGPTPGAMQLRVEVNNAGGDLVIRGNQRRATGSRIHMDGHDKDPNPALRILARRGEPITWIPTPGVALGVYDYDVPALPTGDVEVRTYSEYPQYEARVPIDEAGIWYIMLASANADGGSLIWLSVTEGERQVVEDVDAATPTAVPEGAQARCDGGGGPGAGPAAGVWWAALWWVRRRRAPAGRRPATPGGPG